MLERKEMVSRMRRLKVVLADCDGVLTDGGLYYAEDGTELRKFQVLDGMGFIRLQQMGLRNGIITGDRTSIVDHRARKLHVDYFYKGSLDKLEVIQSIARDAGVDLSEIAYMADDYFDIEALRQVGVSCAPASADSRVRAVVDWVTEKKGGEGCFREFAEMILEAKEEICDAGDCLCDD